MDTNEINKKQEELLFRNQNIFDKFANSVSNVNLGIYSKTFQEKTEYEESVKDKPYSYMPKEVLEKLGFGAFYKYGDLIVECINKMANNENKKEFAFKEQEIQDQSKWSERVKGLKDGNVWIGLVESLKWCSAHTHEERVKKMRDQQKSKK